MSDYYTVQRRRNLIVGIFVVLGLCAFFFLVMIMGDLPVAVSKITSFNIHVQFPETPGITKQSPVQYCGYQVGKVSEMIPPQPRENPITKRTYNQTVAILAIEKKYKAIPSNASIKVLKRGLGSSYIEIKDVPGLEPKAIDANKPETQFLCEGLPVLQGGVGMASEFFPEEMRRDAEELVAQFTELVKSTNIIVGDPNNQKSVSQLLVNAELATAQATETLKEIKELSSAGRSKIDGLSNSITDASEEFTATLRELRTTLRKANEGDGTAAKILNDGRLYENLLDSSAELQLALEQMRLLVTEARDNGVPIKLK